MVFTRASGQILHLRKESWNFQDSAIPLILGSEGSFTMLSTYQFKKGFSSFRATYSRSRNTWDWLSFSCGVAHCGESLISVFQELFVALARFSFSGDTGCWAAILPGLGTLLIFLNFLRS